MDFRFDIIAEYSQYFLRGTLITIGLSLAAVLLGTVIGLIVGIGKMMKNKLVARIFACYVGFFRGTPLLVQILIVHFGVIPAILGKANGVVAAIVALSLNASAYIAETFRAGIQSIDMGQTEASRSLGMTQFKAMRYVILPQAFKRMLPPLGNEFISLIKDSSLASTIATPELMYWAQAMNAQYYRVWEPYLTSALIYLILTLSMGHVVGYMERRMDTK
ncbi:MULTISPECIES: amino acid ABC transporter permease [Clostridium]|uniref:amino acid ABC transporter permease n=1 Tax=Clostridium TaxID=1485 RepID=UPI00082558DD|nr:MULTISPECIES: amino acid ABC transporter permease [Clostridium]PJI09554.1 amino acid ABC transporter permease [Clostridium sp. CT7]